MVLLAMNLPSGELGVTVVRDSRNGMCVVLEKKKQTSPLMVGDYIVSLNGIDLCKLVQSNKQNGAWVMQKWVKLFQESSKKSRLVVVERNIASGVANAAMPVYSAPIAASAARSICSAPTTSAAMPVTSAPMAASAAMPVCSAPMAASAARPIYPAPTTSAAMSVYSAPMPPYPAPVVAGAAMPVYPVSMAAKKTSKPPKTHKVPAPRKSEKKPKKNSGRAVKTTANKNPHLQSYIDLVQSGLPKPGHISPDRKFYVCKSSDTIKDIADAIGLKEWRFLTTMPFNVSMYGAELKQNTVFRRDTVIRIPTEKCSKWKMDPIVDNDEVELREMGKCSKCLIDEKPGDTDEMLLCDGCDIQMHTSCAGLTHVPAGDWLCGNCVDILTARRKYANNAKAPSLPELDSGSLAVASAAVKRFREHMTQRRDTALKELEENHRVLKQSSQQRFEQLAADVRRKTEIVEREMKLHIAAQNLIKENHGFISWTLEPTGKSSIQYKVNGKVCTATRTQGSWRTPTKQSKDWNGAHQRLRECMRAIAQEPHGKKAKAAQKRLAPVEAEYQIALEEENLRPGMEEADRQQVHLNFAALLDEPKQTFESVANYKARAGHGAVFLGVVEVRDSDTLALNVLSEPVELVIATPVEVSQNCIGTESLLVGKEYYLFGTKSLFCPERNDNLPIDFSPTSVRAAQRNLICMLLRDSRNNNLQVAAPFVPPSVKLRGNGQEDPAKLSKMFELSELVRDMNYPIEDENCAPTPKRLAENGLVLRDYQQVSLKWLLEKEITTEKSQWSNDLWHKMRALKVNDVQNRPFFYCQLTGSIVGDIFNYAHDVGQGDASPSIFGCSTSGAILGTEMGLGKTVIAISLIASSPPPLQKRILPREHLAKINHPLYMPPLPVVFDGCVKKPLLSSNATLVIAPMTLCSQWKAEIGKFSPWMDIVTLHHDEIACPQTIASKDIVIISIELLYNSANGKALSLLQKLLKIHFHRIFLDEAHSIDIGGKVRVSVARLSATHRYCMTGTPVGHSLADLYCQMRFLRVPQFCRPVFWKENIENPYCERNFDTLNILRSLLSRMAIRHSKDQCKNGVKLPPRTVETVLLEFESVAEKEVYEFIESRNIERFNKFRSLSPSTVVDKSFELMSMLLTARHACGHPEMIDLNQMHSLNLRIQREELGVDIGMEESLSTTRNDVLIEALTKARSSAAGRMREAVLEFHEGHIDYLECPICLEGVKENQVAITPCAHKFCSECIMNCLQTLSSSREPQGKCPSCRDKFTRSELTLLGDAVDAGEKVEPSALQQLHSKEMRPEKVASMKDALDGIHASCPRASHVQLTASEQLSQKAFCHTLPPSFLSSWNIASSSIGTKISKLLKEIMSMIRSNSSSKCVVFSQFLSTLDIAEKELFAQGLRFQRVDGMMKQYERADALQTFTNDPTTRILLISYKVGATGLNLVAADHCFLLDPVMNVAAEAQAIDRLHRIGQTRPVMVKRFIMKGTVEERIVELRKSVKEDVTTGTAIDGTALLDDEEPKQKKPRYSEENQLNQLGELSYQRLQKLETLFGYGASIKE